MIGKPMGTVKPGNDTKEFFNMVDSQAMQRGASWSSWGSVTSLERMERMIAERIVEAIGRRTDQLFMSAFRDTFDANNPMGDRS